MSATIEANESDLVSAPICQDLVKDKIAFLEGLTDDQIGGKVGQISKNQIGEMLGFMKALKRIGQALDGANSLYGVNSIHGQFKMRRSELTKEQRERLPYLVSAFAELVKFSEYATRPNVKDGNVIWRRLDPKKDTSANPLRDVALPKGKSSRSSGSSQSPKSTVKTYAPCTGSGPHNLVNVDTAHGVALKTQGFDMSKPVQVEALAGGVGIFTITQGEAKSMVAGNVLTPVV
jgi:hypothetical protein